MFVPYSKALKAEIERYLPEPRLINSIFFGGGTPSYLPVNILTDLLGFIKEGFRIKPDAEITIEVNPGTIDHAELALLKSAGFNRLSIGLQARQDRLLKSIGRIHTWDDFSEIYQAGRATGFSNLGVDLIFGLPGQTLQEWGETLRSVVSLQPEHISTYCLQLEKGTVLAKDVERGLVQLPSEDEVVAMMGLAMDYLPKKGYQHYEISNYAKPGFRSFHNLGYWRGNDYLGFGAGAYSTYNDKRWTNIEEPEDYIKAVVEGNSAVESCEMLDQKTKAVERLMLGLRLQEGVDLIKYKAEFGFDLKKTAEPYLTNFSKQNLLKLNGSQLTLTDAGIMVSNTVISSLLNGVERG